MLTITLSNGEKIYLFYKHISAIETSNNERTITIIMDSGNRYVTCMNFQEFDEMIDNICKTK